MEDEEIEAAWHDQGHAEDEPESQQLEPEPAWEDCVAEPLTVDNDQVQGEDVWERAEVLLANAHEIATATTQQISRILALRSVYGRPSQALIDHAASLQRSASTTIPNAQPGEQNRRQFRLNGWSLLLLQGLGAPRAKKHCSNHQHFLHEML